MARAMRSRAGMCLFAVMCCGVGVTVSCLVDWGGASGDYGLDALVRERPGGAARS